VDDSGKAVLARLDRADEIEAQERQVGEIVRGKLLSGKVGVNQAEPPEAAGGGAETVQRGDEDVVVRADDDIGDLPPAGDEEAELAVDLAGELRQVAGQFVGDDTLRRDAPPVDLPDPLDLGRSEAGQVAVNLLDGCSSST